MLDDKTFLDIIRGDCNPGRQLPGDLAQRATDTGDMRANLAMLYGVVRGYSAPQVLEIGTNDGTSTLALLKAAWEVDGHVTSIDIDDVPVARALVSGYGMSDKWTFLRGSSRDVLPQLRAGGKRYKVALVDGDHTYDGAAIDIAHVAAMLDDDGVLFTHDNYMIAPDYDPAKPFGKRATRGCGLVGRDMILGDEWVGCILPWGYNLGIFRKRAVCVADYETAINSAREQGALE